MSPTLSWTTDRIEAEYMAVARHLGHTPRHAELPERLAKAIYNRGLSLTKLARACGLVPNSGSNGRPHPLPGPRPAQELRTAPPAAHALTRRELVRERRASERRQRRVYNPWALGRFRTLGIGRHLEIHQPGSPACLPFAPPDNLLTSRRWAT